MKNLKKNLLTVAISANFLLLLTTAVLGQQKITDTNTPLHALQPDYPTRYEAPSTEEVKAVLDKVFNYLNEATPAKMINEETGEEITNLKKLPEHVTIARGDFRLTSYEWGVTYAGMLHAGNVTGDRRFTTYTTDRLAFIAETLSFFKGDKGEHFKENPFHRVANPRALDDAGAMCAAMIKAARAGQKELTPLIENYIDYIGNEQFRLKDGTLARNRPLPNTLWLDDLFMSVPALAQMGKFSGDEKYYKDAAQQVLKFSKRMFNEDKQLYMHGWVLDMEPHPQFHWARANGWALMAMTELLDVLPENHPNRAEVMDYYKKQAYGLAAYQDPTGFWHQLIDRNDSYLETSATAIYTYSIARGINNGWLDAQAYGPLAILAWNATASKVNDKGQVEGTCVGTGMAFDPAFYYHRPVNVYAAHGYGPVLLAGAEIIRLIENQKAEINDSALIFSPKP